MPSRRIQKVNELIKREVSKILQEEIDDPRFNFVTVMEVNTSPDLDQAKIFLSFLGLRNREKEIKQVLREHQYKIQKRLNRTLEMKNVPKIAFDFDYSSRNAARINQLIKKVKDEQRNQN